MSMAASGKPGTPPPAPLGAMRQLPPLSRARRAPSPGQLARRQFAVRLAKWLLPALAAALLATMMFWPELEGNEERARYAFRRASQPSPEALKVTSPRYQGIDELGRPFTLSAESANQIGSDEMLDLATPQADILLTDGGWVYVEARRGRYDRPHDRLDLNGAVTIFHDNGTMLRTEAATVDLSRGEAEGNLPVAAQGPFGTLTAAGFRLRDRGATVLFTGNAHAVLEGGRP